MLVECEFFVDEAGYVMAIVHCCHCHEEVGSHTPQWVWEKVYGRDAVYCKECRRGVCDSCHTFVGEERLKDGVCAICEIELFSPPYEGEAEVVQLSFIRGHEG